nr:hypothetical protein [Paenibacillus algorifonticola]
MKKHDVGIGGCRRPVVFLSGICFGKAGEILKNRLFSGRSIVIWPE